MDFFLSFRHKNPSIVFFKIIGVRAGSPHSKRTLITNYQRVDFLTFSVFVNTDFRLRLKIVSLGRKFVQLRIRNAVIGCVKDFQHHFVCSIVRNVQHSAEIARLVKFFNVVVTVAVKHKLTYFQKIAVRIIVLKSAGILIFNVLLNIFAGR